MSEFVFNLELAENSREIEEANISLINLSLLFINSQAFKSDKNSILDNGAGETIGKNKRAELSLALKGRLMSGLGNPFANRRRGLGAGVGGI